MAPFANFVGPAYVAPSPVIGADVCRNLYVERNETPGAPSSWALVGTPGLTPFATALQGPGRALFHQDGRAFGVIGYKLQEISSAGVLTDRGDLARDANPAQMASSGDAGAELGVASGGSVYIFDVLTNVLSAPVVGLRLHQIGYFNNRFIGLDQTTSTFWVSGLLDGVTPWTLFAQRSLAGDKWQAIYVADAYVLLLGSETSEFWFADPAAYPFPFSPVPGVLLQYGIAAPFSVAGVDKQPAWLSQSAAGRGMVHRGQGTGEPQRISTHALEAEFATYTTISDAEGSSHQFNGHTFYVLKFPTAGKTWVYDHTASQQAGFPCWHDRSTLRNGVEGAWRAAWHCFAFGKHLVADGATGAIYEMSGTVYDDAGSPLKRTRRAAFVTNSPNQNYYNNFQIMMQVGMGLQTGQGSDPLGMFRMSRDNGLTYGNERTARLGAVGEYFTRVIWSMLGRARGNPVFEFSVSDPVPIRILGADVDVTPGVH